MRPIPLILVSSLVCALGLAPQEERAKADYEQEIRPLLEANCTRCHGPEKQRSGLRLDRESGARAGGYSGEPAIVPGSSETSELVRRIRSSDEDYRMPVDAPPLTAEEVRLLVRWIDEGAPWSADATGGDERAPAAEHWAYRPPVRPALPAVEDGAWARNPVDRFVEERLEVEGIEPSPEADRATLARRLSFDLLGLPPTPEEIDAFVSDESEDAYERLVDRLLASPHFGERWGRHWLDLARYSDSNGGAYDSERSIWPYRDWVIDAVNADMPFDRFTIEQLAGDLLPEPTRDQLIATGFHRNTMIQEEGGADDEEFRVEAVLNRVDTTGTVWLGSTMICAQCHDHKYDPFTQRDYYRMFAFFNQTEDRGRSLQPVLALPTPEEKAEERRITREIAALEIRLTTLTPELRAAMTEWERSFTGREEAWTVLEPIRVAATEGVELELLPDRSLVARGPSPDEVTYTFSAATSLTITALRIEVLPDESFKGAVGRGSRGRLVVTEVRPSVAPLDDGLDGGDPHPVAFVDGTADYETPSFRVSGIADGSRLTGWAVHGENRRAHEAVLVFAEPIGFEDGTLLTLEIEQDYGQQYTLGRFRISVTDADPAPVARRSAAEIGRIIATAPAQRSKKDAALLEEYYLSIAPELDPVREEIARLDASRPQPPTTLVMRRNKEWRPSHVHLGGDFLKKGEEVAPGPPAFLTPFTPPDESATRLDLARWLVSPENPLTARVQVNRWWQRLFGRGLVETENDFGTRGARPSHPELLDWLAVELIESGWRLKPMLRLLVTSATYRQASAPRPDLLEIDPQNRLLARQRRLRLEAEVIRDAMLTASGLLDPRLGGPPVYPPLPGFVSVRAFPKPWPESSGSDRFRRSIYTWHWRTSPYPFAVTFDAPEATVSCTRRRVANTPLQALVLANDPMVFEITQGLARRILVDGGGTDEERLERAFRWCLGRSALARELSVLRDYLGEQRESFAAHPDDARAAAPDDLPADVDPAEAAAWTALARVLFNLDEFVNRD